MPVVAVDTDVIDKVINKLTESSSSNNKIFIFCIIIFSLYMIKKIHIYYKNYAKKSINRSVAING